jgi:SAM-dependent methyltransferase
MSDHIERNRASWNKTSAEYQDLHVSQLGTVEPTWGVWAVPERELCILGDVSAKDILEFGCGGAQWSVALTRRGARMTALDFSAEQLRHARALTQREGVEVTLVEANAEQTPFADASFDIVFCDHGAMTFADPYKTVPEAARILRPGGLFAFNMSTPWLNTVVDWATDNVGDRLLNDYFGMHSFHDVDGQTTFQIPYGEWVRLFRKSGLIIEDLVEIRPKENATTTYDGYAPLEWARRFPAEHIWKVRRHMQ